MAVAVQRIDCPDGLQDSQGPLCDTAQEHGDPPRLKPVDDLLQGMAATGVNDTDATEPQDDDADIRNTRQFIEEVLRCPEEQRAVEPVDRDVLLHQRTLIIGGDFTECTIKDVVLLGLDRAALGERKQRQHGGNGNADLNRKDQVEDDSGEGREDHHERV